MQKFRERRRLAVRPVEVEYSSMRAQGEIRDATAKGFRIASSVEVEPDEPVSVIVQSWCGQGRVSWARNGEFGVELDTPLEPRLFQRLTGMPMRGSRSGAPRFGC